jgi:hypothetical protein
MFVAGAVGLIAGFGLGLLIDRRARKVLGEVKSFLAALESRLAKLEAAVGTLTR